MFCQWTLRHDVGDSADRDQAIYGQCTLEDLVEKYWGKSDPVLPIQASGSHRLITDLASKIGWSKDGIVEIVVEFVLRLSEYISCDNSPSRQLQQEALVKISQSHSIACCTMCECMYEPTRNICVESKWAMSLRYEPWATESNTISDIVLTIASAARRSA